MHAASVAVPHAMLVNLMCCWIAETYTLEAWELKLATLAENADSNEVNPQCASVAAKWSSVQMYEHCLNGWNTRF